MNKRKQVWNLLKSSIRRASMSWQIYASICVVILSTIPTYIDNIEWYSLNNMLAIGANNRFIFSFIVDNHYLPILGPVIAILPYSCSIFEDRKSSYINNIVIRTSPQSYLLSQISITILLGGLVFAVPLLIQYACYAAFDRVPSPVILAPFSMGFFSSVYAVSMCGYILAFIVHCFIYGMVFALFGYSIAINAKNKLTIFLIPLAISYTGQYIYFVVPNQIKRYLSYFLPINLFEIRQTSCMLDEHIVQFSILCIVSIMLIIRGYTKIRNLSNGIIFKTI